MPGTILENVPGMATAMPVHSVDARMLSEHVFRNEYVAHGRPCLIKGAVRHWPAGRKWRDRDYLKRICGRYEVDFWPHENHVTTKRVLPGKVGMPFDAAVERLFSTASHEVAAIGCNPGTMMMGPDLGSFSFFTGGEAGFLYPSFRLFLFRNAGSAWHYHPFDETLMCQLVCTKRVGLLKVDNPHHRQLCDIFYREDYYDDPSVFDALKGAPLQWFSADLDEGDALYIPPLWWHGVIATSDGVGVTTPIGWRSPPHVIADSVRKMAAGDFEIIGQFDFGTVDQLVNTARKLGIEPELEMAWKLGVANGLITVEDRFGNRSKPKPTWPPS